MKLLSSCKMLIGLALAFLVLPAPAAAQGPVCMAEFGAYKQTFGNTSDVQNNAEAQYVDELSRLPNKGQRLFQLIDFNSYEGRIFYTTNDLQEFIEDPSRLRKGAANLATYVTQHAEHLGGEKFRLVICLALSVADVLDGKGNRNRSLAVEPTTPSPRRVQPQPAPLRSLTKTARTADPGVGANLEDLSRPIDFQVAGKLQEISDRYLFKSCSGFDQHIDCERAYQRNQYEAQLQFRKIIDENKMSLGAFAYEHYMHTLQENRNIVYAKCKKLEDPATPCDRASPDIARAPLPDHTIARDGRRALECVRLEQLARSNSSTSGGGSVLANYCPDTVTIGWCSTGGECERGGGNITNLMAGHSWPVDATHEVRWGACHGANTLHGDPGSKGLQYTCSAPDTGG